MLTDFGHSAAHIRVRVEQVVVLLRLPVRKCGQLLRDGLEQANNNANRSGLHVGAEFVHSRRILKEKKKKYISFHIITGVMAGVLTGVR